MVHDFLNKAFGGARFSVVHVCTKSVYEAHNSRISNSFSPDAAWAYKRLYICIYAGWVRLTFLKQCREKLSFHNLILDE